MVEHGSRTGRGSPDRASSARTVSRGSAPDTPLGEPGLGFVKVTQQLVRRQSAMVHLEEPEIGGGSLQDHALAWKLSALALAGDDSDGEEGASSLKRSASQKDGTMGAAELLGTGSMRGAMVGRAESPSEAEPWEGWERPGSEAPGKKQQSGRHLTREEILAQVVRNWRGRAVAKLFDTWRGNVREIVAWRHFRVFISPFEVILNKPAHERSDGDIDELLGLLTGDKFFQDLHHSVVRGLCQVIELKKYDPREVIVHRGDLGQYFYIVLTGAVTVWTGTWAVAEETGEVDSGGLLAVLEKGHSFGEVSLLNNRPRAASVVCGDLPSALLVVHKHHYIDTLRKVHEITIKQKIDFCCRLPLFQGLNFGMLQEFAVFLTEREFLPEEVILQEGAPASSAFFIRSGTVKVFKSVHSCRKDAPTSSSHSPSPSHGHHRRPSTSVAPSPSMDPQVAKQHRMLKIGAPSSLSTSYDADVPQGGASPLLEGLDDLPPSAPALFSEHNQVLLGKLGPKEFIGEHAILDRHHPFQIVTVIAHEPTKVYALSRHDLYTRLDPGMWGRFPAYSPTTRISDGITKSLLEKRRWIEYKERVIRTELPHVFDADNHTPHIKSARPRNPGGPLQESKSEPVLSTPTPTLHAPASHSPLNAVASTLSQSTLKVVAASVSHSPLDRKPVTGSVLPTTNKWKRASEIAIMLRRNNKDKRRQSVLLQPDPSQTDVKLPGNFAASGADITNSINRVVQMSAAYRSADLDRFEETLQAMDESKAPLTMLEQLVPTMSHDMEASVRHRLSERKASGRASDHSAPDTRYDDICADADSIKKSILEGALEDLQKKDRYVNYADEACVGVIMLCIDRRRTSDTTLIPPGALDKIYAMFDSIAFTDGVKTVHWSSNTYVLVLKKHPGDVLEQMTRKLANTLLEMNAALEKHLEEQRQQMKKERDLRARLKKRPKSYRFKTEQASDKHTTYNVPAVVCHAGISTGPLFMTVDKRNFCHEISGNVWENALRLATEQSISRWDSRVRCDLSTVLLLGDEFEIVTVSTNDSISKLAALQPKRFTWQGKSVSKSTPGVGDSAAGSNDESPHLHATPGSSARTPGSPQRRRQGRAGGISEYQIKAKLKDPYELPDTVRAAPAEASPAEKGRVSPTRHSFLHRNPARAQRVPGVHSERCSRNKQVLGFINNFSVQTQARRREQEQAEASQSEKPEEYVPPPVIDGMTGGRILLSGKEYWSRLREKVGDKELVEPLDRNKFRRLSQAVIKVFGVGRTRGEVDPHDKDIII